MADPSRLRGEIAFVLNYPARRMNVFVVSMYVRSKSEERSEGISRLGICRQLVDDTDG